MQKIYTDDEVKFYIHFSNICNFHYFRYSMLPESEQSFESLLKNIAKSCLLAVHYFTKFTTEINKEN